jgi:hypothetical protein
MLQPMFPPKVRLGSPCITFASSLTVRNRLFGKRTQRAVESAPDLRAGGLDCTKGQLVTPDATAHNTYFRSDSRYRPFPKVVEQAMPLHPVMSDFSAAQKEARALLHSLQKRDPVAAGRYSAFDAFDAAPTRLADAQYLVARRYGFKSWAALKSCLTK